MNKTVQVEVSLSKLIGGILTLAALAGVLFTVSKWVFVAEQTHETTHATVEHVEKLEQVVIDVHKRQELDETLWGPEYREKIRKILDSDESAGPPSN